MRSLPAGTSAQRLSPKKGASDKKSVVLGLPAAGDSTVRLFVNCMKFCY